MPHIIDYKFPNFWVNVNESDRYLQTVFEDGTLVPARPVRDEKNIERAISLGYVSAMHVDPIEHNLWTMTKDHELVHSWLAHLRGEEVSFTLWLKAHGWHTNRDDVRVEEAEVLEFQRTLNKTLPRPWDIFFDRGLGDLLGHPPAR